jgi:cytochrome P450
MCLIYSALTTSNGQTDHTVYQKIQEETQNVIDSVYQTSQENLELGLDKTIFHTLLESDIPAEEKLHSRLWQEAQVVIGAGADTTANTLTITHFHILDNPDVHKKLQAELEEALPRRYEPVELRAVENLPYLVSCTPSEYKNKVANLFLLERGP